MTDFTGADVLATRKALKLSREKFSAQCGLTPAKLHNIETGKRDMRPEEREALRPLMSGNGQAPVPTPAQAVQSFTTALTSRLVDVTVLPFDDDLETLWLTNLEEPTYASSREEHSALLAQPEVQSAIAEEHERAARLSDLMSRLSPSSTEAASVLQGVVVPEVEEPELIGVQGLHHNGLRRLTNSEVQTFKHCRRKWWFTWYRGLTPKGTPLTGPLAIGTRVHEALAEWYVPDWKGVDPREALEKLLLRDESALVSQLTDVDADIAVTKLADFKREADLARAMLDGYVQWLQETGADQGYIVIAPERTLTALLETPLDAPNIELTGTVDADLRREHDHAVLFMDHKTCGSIGQLTRMLVWDEQMLMYRVLEDANRNDGEPWVEGALYNMLRKVKRGVTAKPPFYERVEVRHNDHQVQNFKKRLIGEALQIGQVERSLSDGADPQYVVYPSPSQRCLWGCEFNTVCPMMDDGSRAEDFIQEHYVAINPLRRYDDRQATNLVE